MHKFKGDDQKLPHCHPWASFSILLKGRLREYYISEDLEAYVDDYHKHYDFSQKVRMITPGEMIYRKPNFTHRLELVDNPTWSLFITFRHRRTWGFYGKQGFIAHDLAIDENNRIKKDYL